MFWDHWSSIRGDQLGTCWPWVTQGGLARQKGAWDLKRGVAVATLRRWVGHVSHREVLQDKRGLRILRPPVSGRRSLRDCARQQDRQGLPLGGADRVSGTLRNWVSFL